MKVPVAATIQVESAGTVFGIEALTPAMIQQLRSAPEFQALLQTKRHPYAFYVKCRVHMEQL